jgi:uncharacterized membrane protein YkoI
MRKVLLGTAALAGLVMAGVATAATAPGQGSRDPEAAAVDSVKVSLPQAIATAEQHTGGKAYDAGIDTDKGATIVVETSGPKGVQTVAIDANSGKIVSEHQGGEQD